MSRNLLIVKTGALGDLLVATAAIFELCQLQEFASCGLLGPRAWLEILEASSWTKLSQLWILREDGKQARRFRNAGDRWQDTDEQIWLDDVYRNYQATANLRYESIRYGWPAFLQRQALRIGSSPWWSAFIYTHRAPWMGLDPLIHERERNMQVISAYPACADFAKKWQGQGLPKLRQPRIETLKPWGLEAGRYVLINPTASKRFKAWPADRYTALLQLCQEHFRFKGLSMRLIGTPLESNWLREVSNEQSIWIQPSRLDELIDIVAQANFLVANASSMHFIASSFAVPSLVLMGAAKPEVWAPIGPKSNYLKGQIPENFKQASPEAREQAAFQSLSVAAVFAKIQNSSN